LFNHYYRLVAFVCDGDGYVKANGKMREEFFRKYFNLNWQGGSLFENMKSFLLNFTCVLSADGSV
jgi:hypothetical protein